MLSAAQRVAGSGLAAPLTRSNAKRVAVRVALFDFKKKYFEKSHRNLVLGGNDHVHRDALIDVLVTSLHNGIIFCHIVLFPGSLINFLYDV